MPSSEVSLHTDTCESEMRLSRASLDVVTSTFCLHFSLTFGGCVEVLCADTARVDCYNCVLCCTSITVVAFTATCRFMHLLMGGFLGPPNMVRLFREQKMKDSATVSVSKHTVGNVYFSPLRL